MCRTGVQKKNRFRPVAKAVMGVETLHHNVRVERLADDDGNTSSPVQAH